MSSGITYSLYRKEDDLTEGSRRGEIQEGNDISVKTTVKEPSWCLDGVKCKQCECKIYL